MIRAFWSVPGTSRHTTCAPVGWSEDRKASGQLPASLREGLSSRNVWHGENLRQ